LHPMDPPPWCDMRMELTLPNVHSFQLPDPSWHWVSPRWLIDMTQDVDEDGWQYASRFSAAATWHGRHSAQGFVRRRRWLRLRRRYLSEDLGGESEMCVNSALVGGKAGGRPTIRKAASMIKSKVSGGYVGSSPRSPTSPKAKVLAYTLKDGKYRSHCLKSPVVPPMPVVSRGVEAGGRPPMLKIPGRLDSMPDMRTPDETPRSRHYESTRESMEPLPLPTGGVLYKRPLPNELLSAAGSVADTEYSEGGVTAEFACFPRLTPLAPPVAATPLDELRRSVSFVAPNIEARVVARSRTTPPLNRPVEEDAGSTVVASHADIKDMDASPTPSRKRSVASSVASHHSSPSFVDNDLPPLSPYVNPYTPLAMHAAPDHVDERLVGLAADGLRAMLADVRLDRERLEIVRDGFGVGGITAATLWHSWGWVYAAMEYDAGRQRLVAAMLEFAHTCPGEMGVEDVWRRVLRPVVAADGDLFYSDFKMWMVGVARWNLTK
ncbi:hypothetical protein IWW57_003303, partial [Coemansia sp. S610]